MAKGPRAVVVSPRVGERSAIAWQRILGVPHMANITSANMAMLGTRYFTMSPSIFMVPDFHLPNGQINAPGNEQTRLQASLDAIHAICTATWSKALAGLQY